MISIIIPTYNAVPYLAILLEALEQQILTDAEVVVIDSSSLDNTVEIARSHGVRTLSILKHEFDHGLTRTMGAQQAQGEILVYLTQDALPVDREIIGKIGGAVRCRSPGWSHVWSAAPSRLMPRHSDNIYACSTIRPYHIGDRYRIAQVMESGRAFCSNSFAAYRKSALEEVGWFKGGLLMGEDMHACADDASEGV